jgi:hypothetical protein
MSEFDMAQGVALKLRNIPVLRVGGM